MRCKLLCRSHKTKCNNLIREAFLSVLPAPSACLLLLHAPLLSPQACREPHHRLFFPWKGSGHFFLLGGIAIRCTKKRGGGSRSGMAFLTMALLQGRKRRGHSAVQTEWRNGPWPTEVTRQQRSSDHGAWGDIRPSIGPPSAVLLIRSREKIDFLMIET